jgi:FkbM family methyltransferase
MSSQYKEEIFRHFPNLPYSEEIPERMAVLKHLNPQAGVLEVGANKGGVSSMIASVLHDPNNLVAVEPIQSTCDGLIDLGNQLGKKFQVFCGVVRGINSNFLECKGNMNSYAVCTASTESSPTENLTIDEIEQRFNILFDTVVIDCEGCYSSFLHDILNKPAIKQIQIEWDGEFLEQTILDSGFTLVATYAHVCLPKGVRVYDRNV